MPVVQVAAPQREPVPGAELAYLDGLRGVLALYVVVYHAQVLVTGLPARATQMLSVVALGRFAVTIFIILSGYCLMLPIARSNQERLVGGTVAYIKRRARRLLPPYYAALVISLLLSGLLTLHGSGDRNAVSDFSPSALISHALLLQNMNTRWAMSINPAMWSVATEWQIYFFFPLVLLPLWRRIDMVGMVLVAFALGLLPFFAFHAGDLISPWYLGVFALGMAGAEISFSSRETATRYRERLPWRFIANASLALFLLAIVGLKVTHSEQLLRDHLRWAFDAVLGVAAMAFMIGAAKRRASGERRSATLRALESPVALELGAFSYSLYLMHNILLEAVRHFVAPLNLHPMSLLGTLLVIGVPITLVCSYLFSLAFEKPFLRKKTHVVPKARVAGAPDVAAP
jgi:peptidoglycan/LPS O-acetylase OafA/YrhL